MLNMTSSITKGVLSFELSLQKIVSLIVEIQIHLHWGLEWFPSWRLTWQTFGLGNKLVYPWNQLTGTTPLLQTVLTTSKSDWDFQRRTISCQRHSFSLSHSSSTDLIQTPPQNVFISWKKALGIKQPPQQKAIDRLLDVGTASRLPSKNTTTRARLKNEITKRALNPNPYEEE